MDFTIIIQQDKEGWFLGSIPNLHGCRTQAKTLTQLYKRLEEVTCLCLENKNIKGSKIRHNPKFY